MAPGLNLDTAKSGYKVVNVHMLARPDVARGFADRFAIFGHYCADGNGHQRELVAQRDVLPQLNLQVMAAPAHSDSLARGEGS
jgi:hypothetical protein